MPHTEFSPEQEAPNKTAKEKVTHKGLNLEVWYFSEEDCKQWSMPCEGNAGYYVTVICPFGRDLIEYCGRFRQDVDNHVHSRYKEWKKDLAIASFREYNERALHRNIATLSLDKEVCGFDKYRGGWDAEKVRKDELERKEKGLPCWMSERNKACDEQHKRDTSLWRWIFKW